MIYATKEVKFLYNGQVRTVTPEKPLDLVKSFDTDPKVLSSVEAHLIGKYGKLGLTQVKPIEAPKSSKVETFEVVPVPEPKKSKGGRPKKTVQI